jgi:hypothetical protein
MIYGKLLKHLLVVSAQFILFLGINSSAASAQTDLVVEGNVLGYNLYTVRPSGFDGITFPVLLKVRKITEGKERSEYIVVLLTNLDKSFAEENFGLNKTLTFKLYRKSFCDKKLKNLMYPGLTLKDGMVVKTSQTFILAPGVEKKMLPLNKVIPCYWTS